MSMNGRTQPKGDKKKLVICLWCVDTRGDVAIPTRQQAPAVHSRCDRKARYADCDCPQCWPDPTEMRSLEDAAEILKLDVPKKP